LITGNTTTENAASNGGAGIYNDGTIKINKADILSNATEAIGIGGGIYKIPADIVTLNHGAYLTIRLLMVPAFIILAR
jgi:hypothetical protein